MDKTVVAVKTLLIPSTADYGSHDIRLTMRKISVTWAIASAFKKPDHLVAQALGSDRNS